MKFFIDTANLDQIKEAQDMGILDGVTTNPSLMAKEGITGEKNIIDHYLKICDIVDGDVSAEVISVNYDGIIKEGEILASLHKQIVIKVPMIEEGVKAIRYFSDKGLKTNCTLIFSWMSSVLLSLLTDGLPDAESKVCFLLISLSVSKSFFLHLRRTGLLLRLLRLWFLAIWILLLY